MMKSDVLDATKTSGSLHAHTTWSWARPTFTLTAEKRLVSYGRQVHRHGHRHGHRQGDRAPGDLELPRRDAGREQSQAALETRLAERWQT